MIKHCKKEMSRFIFILIVSLIFILTINSVLALSGCYIDTDTLDCAHKLNPLFDYTSYGYVSAQGHFSSVSPGVFSAFQYPLCCPDFWPFGYGSGSFKYSTLNETGHVSVNNSVVTNFDGIQYLGTYDCIYVANGDCPADKACIFKMSNPDSSHIMDCSEPNNPVNNDFTDKLCCKPYELCWDNLDNDEDGFIDCADSECNGLNTTAGVGFGTPYKQPELCTDIPTNKRTNYDTNACIISWTNPGTPIDDQIVVWNSTCIGEPDTIAGGDTHYYCNFEHRDRFVDVTSTPGYCCMEGFEYNSGTGYCEPTDPCGPDCNQDFDWSFVNWYDNHYPTVNNWCNSIIPDLYSPDTTPTEGIRSDACCLISKFGEVNNYVDEDNVHVW